MTALLIVAAYLVGYVASAAAVIRHQSTETPGCLRHG